MLKIKLVKSPIAHHPRNRATIAALGLRKIGQVVERPDSPSIRGMIHKVMNLVVVEAPQGGEPIVDATHKGSSSRMVDARIHRKFSAPAAEIPEAVPAAPKRAARPHKKEQ